MICREDRYGKTHLKKLKKEEVKEQCQVTRGNKFSALENLEGSGDNNRAWDNVKENIKILEQESLSYCELNYHKTWLDEECSKLFDQRKQVNYSGCRTQVE
jgi:hypothetical protein